MCCRGCCVRAYGFVQLVLRGSKGVCRRVFWLVGGIVCRGGIAGQRLS